MSGIKEPLPLAGVELPYQMVLDRFKKRRSEASVLIPVLEKLNDAEKSLAEATVCLSIGPGGGYNDLDFLQKCLPNLKKYIALDKRRSMLTSLENNFRKIFGDSVEYEDYEADAADWELPEGQKVDIVWMSHMLYTIPKEKRLKIFEKLIKKFVNPRSGRIIFVNNTGENCYNKIHTELGIHPLLTSDEIKEEFIKSGGKISWNYVYSCVVDLSEYDHDLYHYLMELSDRVLTPAEIMRAVKIITPSGISDYQSEICVVKCA